ncbi:MAG: trehalose-phosphatase [Thermomicrobiaceae bacterium]
MLDQNEHPDELEHSMIKSVSAIELLRLVLENPPSGILTDIDGTISKIAPHPDQAIVEPDARTALASLAHRVVLVGAVSGRSALDARQLVGLDDLVYSGNHGMEVWRDGNLEQSPLALKYTPRIADALARFDGKHPDDGLYLENKGLTASIHFRGASNPEATAARILPAIERLATEYELVVTHGRMVFELRPPVELSKGTSVLDLMDDYRLESLIYLGDDLTDVDAFDALRARRADVGGHAYGIGVKGESTPIEVLERADAFVSGVEGAIELLNSPA